MKTFALASLALPLLLVVGWAYAQIDTGEDESVYSTNCASCHPITGEGVAGVFPPLVGHVPAISSWGPRVPRNLLLYGFQGEIGRRTVQDSAGQCRTAQDRATTG